MRKTRNGRDLTLNPSDTAKATIKQLIIINTSLIKSVFIFPFNPQFFSISLGRGILQQEFLLGIRIHSPCWLIFGKNLLA